MNCPICDKRMSEYKTILNCDNRDCVMYHAILNREQWQIIHDLITASNKIAVIVDGLRDVPKGKK